jgi:hypothetical protein
LIAPILPQIVVRVVTVDSMLTGAALDWGVAFAVSSKRNGGAIGEGGELLPPPPDVLGFGIGRMVVDDDDDTVDGAVAGRGGGTTPMTTTTLVPPVVVWYRYRRFV